MDKNLVHEAQVALDSLTWTDAKGCKFAAWRDDVDVADIVARIQALIDAAKDRQDK